MALFQKAVDYCADDSVQVAPKYKKDYIPEGYDPMTMKPIENPLAIESVINENKIEEESTPQEPTKRKYTRRINVEQN